MHAGATEFEQVEGAVADAGVFLGDGAGIADVGLAHLQEDAAGGDQPQRRVDELAGQGVQHHIEAAATGHRAELLLEFQTARVRHVVVIKAHGPQGVPLAAARGGENLQTQVPGQLHRSHANPAGAGVNQDPLSGLDVGQVDECEVGRGEHGRYGGGFGVGPVDGHRQQQSRIAGDQGSAAVREKPEDRITLREFGDTGTNLDDHAGAFATDQRIVGEQAQDHHDVAEVRRDRTHGHPNVTGLQRRAAVGHRLQSQVFEGSRAAEAEPPGNVAWGCQEAAEGTAGAHARHVHRAVAHQNLGLAGRQHRGDCRIIEGFIAISEHDAPWVLGLRRAHQPPDGSSGQVGDIRPRQRHRAAGRHQQNPGVEVRQPGQHGSQRLMRSPIHRRDWVGLCGRGFEHLIRREITAGNRRGRGRPGQLEEAVRARTQHRRAQLLLRHGPRRDRRHRQHRQPQPVGPVDRQRRRSGRTRRCDPHPDRRGARGM